MISGLRRYRQPAQSPALCWLAEINLMNFGLLACQMWAAAKFSESRTTGGTLTIDAGFRLDRLIAAPSGKLEFTDVAPSADLFDWLVPDEDPKCGESSDPEARAQQLHCVLRVAEVCRSSCLRAGLIRKQHVRNDNREVQLYSGQLITGQRVA